MIKFHRFIILTAIFAISGFSLFQLSPLSTTQVAQAQGSDTVCYVFAADLTNNTGATATAEFRFLSPKTFVPISAGATLTLAPGENDVLRLAAFIPADEVPPVPGGGPNGLTINSTSLGRADDNVCLFGGNVDPNGDPDGDGILNRDDNCIFTPNVGQEDGWSSALGDACDTEYYDSGGGIKIYPLKNGSFVAYAACQNSVCYPIASFRTNQFTQDPAGVLFADGVAGWYVTVYYLGNEGGQSIYQVNTYNSGLLQDDGMLISVNDGGFSTWRYRVPR